MIPQQDIIDASLAFQPFVDENAKRKENSTPAPLPKVRSYQFPSDLLLILRQFKPFVDAELPSKLPTFTPNLGRRALSVKESTTPAPITKPSPDENAPVFKPQPILKVSTEESQPAAVFSVFTPISVVPKDRPQARKDVFTDDQAQGKGVVVSPVEPASVFTPFRDADAPIKVFSRPLTRNENPLPLSQSSAFRPYVDGGDENQPPAPSARPVLGERAPLRAFARPAEEEPQEEVSHIEDESFDEYEEQYEDYVEQDAVYDENAPAAFPIEDDSMYDEEADGTDYRPPLGGRFGQFDVLTPITERTFEFTASTRGSTLR